MRLWPITLLLFLPRYAAAEPAHRIDLDRGKGPEAIELGVEKLEDVERYDLQLDQTRTFRGIRLSRLLERYPGPKDAELVVLSFANGMRIPVPLTALPKIDPLIAIASRRGNDAFDDSFPDVPKKKAAIPDPRPIHFDGNKVVVATATHPRLPEGAEFTPWAYVDALRAVSFATVADDELRIAGKVNGEPSLDRGREVFLARCQWCHGVGGRGAHYGWDFVKPVPLHTWRTSKSLLGHVRYKNIDAVERGYMMPPQKDIQEADVDDLWKWMRSVGAAAE
ncbi:MAG: cytochrome c [Myxococcota bacterium]